MLKYNVDLDYVIPPYDISTEELNDIIDEADKIIIENNLAPAKLAVAYLKKAQAMQKLVDCMQHETQEKAQNEITSSGEDTQSEIKKLIEKALELSPDMPEALMQMGKVFHKTPEPTDEHFLKAIEMYSKAIQLKPDYPAAYNNRANAYDPDISEFFCSKNSFEDANNINGEFLGMLSIYIPDDDDSFKRDSLKAIADYTEAIRLRPHDPVYYFNRGRRYVESKEHEKAIDDFTALLHYSSDEFKKKLMISHQRGQEYMKIKNYEKAIDDFTESMRLCSDKTESLFLRAKSHLLNGEYDKAKSDLAEYKRLKIEKRMIMVEEV